MTIQHLMATPQHIPVVAHWIHTAFWSDHPSMSPEILEGLLRAAADPDRIPLSLLAWVDGAPAGTVNLIDHDDPDFPELSPWLAALFVRPEARGRGVGSRLVNALVGQAQRLGCPDLYLGTDQPGFYRRFGARAIISKSRRFVIMRLAVA